ncbi:ribokinase [Williamsia sp. M5A3_1d]
MAGAAHDTGTVAVVGSINVDEVAEVERIPRPGETVLATASRRNLGGKGANQAVAARIVTDDVAFIGRVGTDVHGEFLREGLHDHGVDVDMLVAVDGYASGAAHITVADGENTIVVVGGANRAWDRLEADEVTRVAGAAVVVCQLEIPQTVVDDTAAHTRGRFILNAAPAGPVSTPTLRRCDPVIVNEHELAALTGHHVDDVASATAAATALRGQGALSVVATLGAAGAVWVTDDGDGHCSAPTVSVVDSTGAGDLFVGVLAARLATGTALHAAVADAVAAASMSVGAVGTLDSYPSRADV